MKFWMLSMPGKSFRLETGGRINRSEELEFRFNNKIFKGYAGDTLASALLANGVKLVSRSFKYHRPRGIVGAGFEEAAALVQLDGDGQGGNSQPTTVQLYNGLSAVSVNCWPSPKFDFGAINQFIAPFIPAGFYYKTFKSPNWHLYEPMIRKAAGLAAAPATPPAKGRHESRYAHADILIIGAGLNGLIAALLCGRAGVRVILVDDGSEAGGSLLNRRMDINGQSSNHFILDTVAELATLDNVTHLQSATAWGYREHNFIMVNERTPDHTDIIQRNWKIRAKYVLAATGATERFLVFPNNDRPGVMLASALQTYVHRYAVQVGKKVILFANNDSIYEVASTLLDAGINVAAIVDSRSSIPERLRDNFPKIKIFTGSVIEDTFGGHELEAVKIKSVKDGNPITLSCDVLGVSGGWNPNVQLHSQSRGTIFYDDKIAAFRPDKSFPNLISVGAANGCFGLKEGLIETEEACRKILAGLDIASPSITLPKTRDDSFGIEPLWFVSSSHTHAKAFVDLQNDVTWNDIALAQREGYGAVEHAKRYTTAGMGFDQGKIGNINVIGLLASLNGISMNEVGTTTFRSPYTPVEFGAIAGARKDAVVLPYRHTPVTDWHKEAGAVMYEAGARWRRPGYYPKSNEPFQECVNREARAVRENVGVYDGAPLGTFDISGPDAAAFLDFIYTSKYSDLPLGMGRYGLMLTEDGLIFDDGVSFRLGQNHFLMSTSTANADAVYQHMEKCLQIDRPHWNVRITDLTSYYMNATLCGPRARDVLKALGTDIDLDPDSFPFMAIREGRVATYQARVARVSFTGELSFEINVRSRDLLPLWKDIMRVGDAFGITPIGSEANHVLRVEKGFLSLGHEVDGTADPYDLGMGWAISKKKDDFIGKRSVNLRRSTDMPRRELVGVKPVDPAMQIPEGAPLTPGGQRQSSEGFVTACVWSVTEKQWAGLALLENGRARIGKRAHVRLPDKIIEVEITKPIFHDPDGLRLRS
jgi:sarcosine oxidase, subunit alpha